MHSYSSSSQQVGVGRFTIWERGEERDGARGELLTGCKPTMEFQISPSLLPPLVKSSELCEAISVHFCILGTFEGNLSASGYFRFLLKIIRIHELKRTFDSENYLGGGRRGQRVCYPTLD